jgi:hypothetical protein
MLSAAEVSTQKSVSINSNAGAVEAWPTRRKPYSRRLTPYAAAAASRHAAPEVLEGHSAASQISTAG